MALHVLLDARYEVTAFYLHILFEGELLHLRQCPWEDDCKVYQQVFLQVMVNVPLNMVPLQYWYRDMVVEYIINKSKISINPEEACNRDYYI